MRLFKQILVCLMLLMFSLKDYAQSATTKITSNIQMIVNKLEKESLVHLGYPVGYSAKPEKNNKYFRLYKKLLRKASDDELLQLTNQETPNIVVYAYKALYDRNFSGLKDVFLNHVNDTTWFWTAGGCTGVLERINRFMLRHLKPDVNNVYRYVMTKQEYDIYYDQLKKKEDLFYFD